MSAASEVHKQHLSITTALVRADAYVLADLRPLDDLSCNVSDVPHGSSSLADDVQHDGRDFHEAPKSLASFAKK